MTLVLREDFLTELILEILADNENNLSKTSLNSIVDAVVHDCLTIWAQTIELFQTTITATHSGSQKQ